MIANSFPCKEPFLSLGVFNFGRNRGLRRDGAASISIVSGGYS